MKKSDNIKEQPELEASTVAESEILLENEGKVGGILKQARLRQGKKITEIAQNLCIRKAYLEAIEESRYDSIPEFPYGLGFIRSYADYLGEDSSQIVRMYKDETSAKFGSDNKIYVLEPQVEATVPSRKYLLISLLAIAATYFMWLTYNNYHNNVEATMPEEKVETAVVEDNTEFPLVVEDYAPAAEDNNADVEEDKADTDTIAPVEESAQVVVKEGNFVEEVENKPTADTNAALNNVTAPKTEEVADSQIPAEALTSPAPGKSNIVIKIKKETWVEVKNENKLYLSKVLPAGTVYALPKAEGLIFSAGRVDGVDVYVGGQLVEVVKPNKKTNISLDEVLKNINH